VRKAGCDAGRRLVFGLSAVAALLMSATAVSAQEASVADVVDRYVTARNRGDLSGALTLFSDGASVTEPSGQVYASAGELRRLLRRGITRGEAIRIADRRQVADYVSWEERVSSPGSVVVARARAIIRNGRIRSLKYGAASPREASYEDAPDDAEFPAATGLIAVVLVLAGVFALILTSTRSKLGSGNCPTSGRLLPGLKLWSESRRDGGARRQTLAERARVSANSRKQSGPRLSNRAS